MLLIKKYRAVIAFSLLILSIASVWLLNTIERDPLVEEGKWLEHLAQLSPEEQATQLTKATGIDQAMLQDFMRTKDPKLGYVPAERRFEAYKIAKEKLANKSQQRAIQNVVWAERGPNNVGGRTRALMFDPNDANRRKVWAGGVAGGLWYTNDITSTSASYIPVDDFMSNLAISCLAFDPSNTNNFYAGTGEGWFNGGSVRGAGIWKSSNGGTTWARLESTNNSQFYFVQKIVVLSNGNVLAATHTGIYRSTDGGNSWNIVLSGNRGADLEVAADGTVYASLGIFQTGSVHKSTNNGQNWTNITPPVTGGQRIELAVAPSDANVVYAVASSSNNSAAWFQKSINAGTSWTSVTIPANVDGSSSDFTRGQAWYDLILAVFPNDPERVIVGGVDLYLSANGGTSWSGISHWYGGFGKPFVHADQHAIVFRPNSSTDAIFGHDGGVSYSNNLTSNTPAFITRIKDYNVTQFYACALANNSSQVMLAGAQDNGTHLFNAAGINSTQEVVGGDGAYCFINQQNANVMIASYVFNNYYVSTNGGASFSNLGNDDSGSFINPADYDSQFDILYSTGDAGILKRITNVSSSTTRSALSVAINGGRITALKVSPYTNHRVYIGTNGGRVYRIDNANATPSVTLISNGITTGNLTVNSIDVGSSDNRLLATVSNYGAVSVYETTDGGNNWINKEGDLPDMPVRWGIYNPNNNNEVMLATEVGVWSTDNISANSPVWEPTNQGLANVSCHMLKYRASDGMVAIATHGRGLFTTNAFEADQTAVANFNASVSITYTGKSVSFTDESQNANNQYNWTFGDGSTSSQKNPNHSFSQPGLYEVTLVVANGADGNSRSRLIQVLPDKQNQYSLAEGGNFESNELDFGALNVAGTGFERGNSSVAKKAGTTSGSFGWVTGLTTNTYVDNSTAYLMSPNFSIGSNPTILKFNTKFSFEDDWDGFIVEYSTNKGDTWTRLGNAVAANWYNATTVSDNVVFPPNSPFFSRNTANLFVAMEYDISSFAGQQVAFRFTFKTDPAITDAGVAIDDFEISAENASFSMSKSIIYEGGSIQFTDASTSAGNSWLWNFGDNGTSTLQNPSHTFNQAGEYQVSLSVAGQTSTIVQTVYVLPTLGSSFTNSQGADLEGTDFLFANETVLGTGFKLGKHPNLGANSGNNTWATGLTGDYEDNSHAILYGPNFSFTNIAAEERYLSFKVRLDLEAGFDGMFVEFSTNKGESWSRLGNQINETWYTHTNNGVFGNNATIFSGKTSTFVHKYFNLQQFIGQENIAFRYVFRSDGDTGGKGLALDDIQVVNLLGVISGTSPQPVVSMRAYPNPVAETLHLEFNNASNELYQVRIVDLAGKLIYQNDHRNSGIAINLSAQPKGLYIIQVQTNGKTFVEKVIKN